MDIREKGKQLTFEPGDHVAIFPANRASLVQDLVDLTLQSTDPTIYRSTDLQIHRFTDPPIYRSTDLPIQCSSDLLIHRS